MMTTELYKEKRQNKTMKPDRVVGAKRGDGESAFHGDRVSVWEDEKVLEMMVGTAAQQRECA